MEPDVMAMDNDDKPRKPNTPNLDKIISEVSAEDKKKQERLEKLDKVIELSERVLEIRAAISKKMEEVAALQDSEASLTAELDDYIY